MADSIGSESFVYVRGPITGLQQSMADITRPGVNGSAFKDMGTHAGDCELAAGRDYASWSAANTSFATYEGLIGTVVSIVQGGQTKSNMLLMNVRRGSQQNMAAAVGGLASGTHWMETLWTVRYVGTS